MSAPAGAAQNPVMRELTAGRARTNAGVEVAAAEAPGNSAEANLAEARLILAQVEEAGGTNAPAGISTEEIWMRRALASRLVRLHEQQVSNVGALEKARTRKAETTREAQAWSRFADAPPYSVLVTDELREQIQTERRKVENGEAMAKTMEQILVENRAQLVEAEERVRQLNEALEGEKDPAVAARLTWQRELGKLRGQVAGAMIGWMDSERAIGQETLEESRQRLALLRRQISVAEADLSFTQQDLDKVRRQLERDRVQLEWELAEAQGRRETSLKELERAREEQRAENGKAARTEASALLVERIRLREAQLDAADTSVSVLRLMLEGSAAERSMWELRFAAFGSQSVDTLQGSQRRLEAFSHRQELWQTYSRRQLQTCSGELQLQETRMNNLAPGSALLPLARERLQTLRDQESLLLRLQRAIERLQRLTDRWAEGLREAETKLPLTGQVRNFFTNLEAFGQRVWGLEVFTAEDVMIVDGQKIVDRRSVTIGKIVKALLILAVGIWITGLITRVAEPLIVRRLKIEPNQAGLMRRWLRALMIACLVVLSLISVKIPLTVFAFAGGALAIGLGFGMQTVLKNFVSGLILLFERPFRVGDVLDVAGQKGTVTSIGLRASVFHMGDGTETLVPNSSLLENSVTNSTYSNNDVRFVIRVGVAYGSDPRLVMQLMNEVADRHGLVEKQPKPQVLFMDFGESTLDFELRVFMDITKASSAQVCSDLRLMIMGAFAEHGIDIAYPQRDVRLTTAKPLTVQVVGEAREANRMDLSNAPAALNPGGGEPRREMP